MVPPLRVLQENGVVIEEDPRCITPLPASARELRDLLLNFNDAVPREAKFHLEDLCHADSHLMNPRMRPDQSAYCDSKHKSYEARWIAAQEMRQRARGFSSDARQKEETWQNFMTGSVLGDINEQASSNGIFMRDLVAMSSKALFTNAVEIRGMLSGNQCRPQPDVCLGLSLFDGDQVSHLKGTERFDKGIVHFEENRISNLHTDDGGILTCRPIRSMPKLAFPWTIAEFKKESGDEPEALRQAANGSYTCVKLCEHLADRAGEDSPPLVAITSVGPRIKLFVTYGESHRGRRIYRMSCIWTGHVQHIWSAVQLQCIVYHLMFWALRIFKPWVTECLTECYRKDALSVRRQDEENSSGDDSSDSGSDHTPRRRRTGRQPSSKSSSSATSDHSDTQNASDVSESASESASDSTSSDPSSNRYPPVNSNRPLSERSDIYMQRTDREMLFPRPYTQADTYSRPVVKNSRKIIVNLPQAHLYNTPTNSQLQSTQKPTLFGHAVASQRSGPDPRESIGTSSDLNSPGAERITDRCTPLSVAGESGSGHNRASSISTTVSGQRFEFQLFEDEGNGFGQYLRQRSKEWAPPPQLPKMSQSLDKFALSFSSIEPSQEITAERSDKDFAENVKKDAAVQTMTKDTRRIYIDTTTQTDRDFVTLLRQIRQCANR